MKSGPEPEVGSSSEPELPGEFVSNELRADCARFLDELRAVLRRRRGEPDEQGAWLSNKRGASRLGDDAHRRAD